MLDRFWVGAILPLVAGCAMAQTPIRLVPDTGSKLVATMVGTRVAHWGGGALVQFQNSGTTAVTISISDRNGQNSSAGVTMSDVSEFDVYDYSRGASGAMGLCGYTRSGDDHRPYLLWMSPDGMTQKVVRTFPYWPYRVAVAADGALWTLGYEMIDGSETRPGVDRNAGVIRHFDQAGTVLGSYVPRSSVKEKLDLSYGRLAISKDRVGWFSHRAGQAGAYVEVFPSGEIERYPMPTSDGATNPGAGVALNDSNQAWVAVNGGNCSVLLYTLDRQKRDWVRVTPPPVLASKCPWLAGSNADDLAFVTRQADTDPQTLNVQFVRTMR